jgi:hypothetical protein
MMMVSDSSLSCTLAAGRYAEGIIRSHGVLADGDTTNKDGVHLMVVQYGLVEELGVFGVILNRDDKEDC